MRLLSAFLGMIGLIAVVGFRSSQMSTTMAFCDYCRDYTATSGGYYYHNFPANNVGALFDDPHQEYFMETCGSHHSACEMSLTDQNIESARWAAARSDLGALRVAITKLGSHAVINDDASTLDLLSCDRALIARFAVRSEIIAALQDT